MDTRAVELAALRTVQRRVSALAFFAVAIHGVVGLIVVARVVHGQGRYSDAVILTLMSGVFAIVTCVVVRLILQRKPFSPAWVAAAVTPTAIALWALA